MATRIYFPSTGAATISPAYDAGWEDTSLAGSRLKAVRTKISSAMASTLVNDTTTADQDLLCRQWVLEEALRAQTIAAQTIKIQMLCKSGSNATLQLAWLVKVVSSDGLTSRGTLIAAAGAPKRDGTNMNTSTLTNRGDSQTCASVVVQDGDFLVFELGGGGTSIFNGHKPTIRYGDSGGSDLPEDDISTSDIDPWVEFANDVLFGPLAAKNKYRSSQAVIRSATR